MRPRRALLIALFLTTAATLAGAAVPRAQEARVVDDEGWCDDSGRRDDHERHCEVREVALQSGSLRVDAEVNGGIQVRGWDGDEIRVRARVRASAERMPRAREIAGDIRLAVSGDRVRSDGPRTGDHEWWSVSYRIDVPRRTDLELEAHNGGITIADVDGRVRFDTTNGGVSLENLAGDVTGSTVNGGVSVRLAGSHWSGDRLDVKTTNGGIDLAIPESYNAELETGTVNGRVRLDFPVTVQGRIDRQVRITLGDGGAPIRVVTTNGGVRVRRP